MLSSKSKPDILGGKETRHREGRVKTRGRHGSDAATRLSEEVTKHRPLENCEDVWPC